METMQGGVREDAGRKPKAMMYGDAVMALEQKILASLPDVIDKMLEKAKDGDHQSAKYLIERIMGRVPRLVAPPAEDRALPYADEDLEMAVGRKAWAVENFRNVREERSKPREIYVENIPYVDFVAKCEAGVYPLKRLNFDEQIQRELARHRAAEQQQDQHPA